jgi:hypothetical protein
MLRSQQLQFRLDFVSFGGPSSSGNIPQRHLDQAASAHRLSLSPRVDLVDEWVGEPDAEDIPWL